MKIYFKFLTHGRNFDNCCTSEDNGQVVKADNQREITSEKMGFETIRILLDATLKCRLITCMKSAGCLWPNHVKNSENSFTPRHDYLILSIVAQSCGELS